MIARTASLGASAACAAWLLVCGGCGDSEAPNGPGSDAGDGAPSDRAGAGDAASGASGSGSASDGGEPADGGDAGSDGHLDGGDRAGGGPGPEAGLDGGTRTPDGDADMPGGDGGGDAGLDAGMPTGEPSCRGAEQLLQDIDRPLVLSAGTCWRVRESLRTQDADFTIEPGAVLTFEPEGSLVISGGTVRWLGTGGDGAIVLRGSVQERGHWGGVSLGGSASADYVLRDVVIADAGRSTLAENDPEGVQRAGLLLSGSASVALTRVTLRNHHVGLRAIDSRLDLHVSQSVFRDNGVAAVVRLAAAGGFAEGNQFAAQPGDDPSVHIGDGDPAPDDSEEHWVAELEATALGPGPTFTVIDPISIRAPLTLRPGTTVRFARDMGWNFWSAGQLDAQGTADSPILLTGVADERGYWGGIRFGSTSTTGDEVHALSHAVLANAGSAAWGPAALYFTVDDMEMTVRDVLFRDNAGYAFAQGGLVTASSWTLDRCAFRGNAVPIRIDAPLLASISSDLQITGNDRDVIQVGEPSGAVPVQYDDLTVAAYPVPVVFEYSFGMDGAVLTVEPGATLQFAANRGISFRNGGRVAIGGPGALTTLTRKPGSGAWAGLHLDDGSTGNVIENTLIAYGGAGTTNGAANVRMHFEASLEINDTRLENSAAAGLSLWATTMSGASILAGCENVSYQDNAGDDLITVGVADGATIPPGCRPSP